MSNDSKIVTIGKGTCLFFNNRMAQPYPPLPLN